MSKQLTSTLKCNPPPVVPARLFAAVSCFFFIALCSAQDFDVNRNQLLQDLKTLSADSMAGRKSGTEGSTLARAYIKKRLQESGIEPHEQPFTFNDKAQTTKQTGVNVIGTIKGTLSERTIVITAHYDHLGIKNGEIYNGADDNASGVAALFAVAAHFTQNSPANSLIIAALDAEEGSGAGGNRLVSSLDRSKILMNINLDMVGRDHQGILYAVGTHHYPWLKRFVTNIAAKAPVKLLAGHDVPNLKGVEDWTRESDHYAFHKLGIPFIYFGVEDFEHHHKATDDYENMTHDFFVNAVKTILLAIHDFDKNL